MYFYKDQRSEVFLSLFCWFWFLAFELSRTKTECKTTEQLFCYSPNVISLTKCYCTIYTYIKYNILIMNRGIYTPSVTYCMCSQDHKLFLIFISQNRVNRFSSFLGKRKTKHFDCLVFNLIIILASEQTRLWGFRGGMTVKLAMQCGKSIMSAGITSRDVCGIYGIYSLQIQEDFD